MEVTNEAELEGFLGGLLSKGVGALGKAIGGPTMKALGGVLKDAAKAVLPIAGGALGSLAGPAGEQVGQALGSAASNLFEAEAEAEEREWEAANVFVEVSLDALNHAADAPPHAHPQHIARHAVDAAMRRTRPSFIGQRASQRASRGGNARGTKETDIREAGFATETQ